MLSILTRLKFCCGKELKIFCAEFFPNHCWLTLIILDEIMIISLGEFNTILSAYTLYRQDSVAPTHGYVRNRSCHSENHQCSVRNWVLADPGN